MAERKKVKKVSLSKQGETKPKAIRKGSSPKTLQRVKSTQTPKKQKTLPKTVSKEKKFEVKEISLEKSVPKSKTKPTTNKRPQTYPTSKNNAYRSEKKSKSVGINWSILLGKKREIRRKRISKLLISLPLVILLVLFVFCTPTGPFEATVNFFSQIGGGKFPKQISGSNTVSLSGQGNVAMLLSDTHISGYTSSGKEIFSIQHDYSVPSLETSKARSLVFNRNSTGFTILNNGGAVMKRNLDKPILCADIAENGTLAFVTKSEKYSASVDIYNKKLKHKFSWYLVDGLISDVTLSKNGKFVAIAVLKAKDGSFSSEIYCFNTRSENPLFKISVEGAPVLSLQNISSKYFSYVTNAGVSYVKWRNGQQIAFNEAGLSPSFYKNCNGNSLVVYGKNTSSVVKIISLNATEKSRFVYNGLIDDATLSGKTIYILKGNKIFSFDFEGNLLNTFTSEQTAHFISSAKNGVFAAENINLTYFGG